MPPPAEVRRDREMDPGDRPLPAARSLREFSAVRPGCWQTPGGASLALPEICAARRERRPAVVELAPGGPRLLPVCRLLVDLQRLICLPPEWRRRAPEVCRRRRIAAEWIGAESSPGA